jgi:hypothetical protein
MIAVFGSETIANNDKNGKSERIIWLWYT